MQVARARQAKELGAAIVKRNLKIGDIVSKWDADGDGQVSRKEFSNGMAAMGIEVSKAEVDEVFKFARNPAAWAPVSP